VPNALLPLPLSLPNHRLIHLLTLGASHWLPRRSSWTPLHRSSPPTCNPFAPTHASTTYMPGASGVVDAFLRAFALHARGGARAQAVTSRRQAWSDSQMHMHWDTCYAGGGNAEAGTCHLCLSSALADAILQRELPVPLAHHTPPVSSGAIMLDCPRLLVQLVAHASRPGTRLGLPIRRRHSACHTRR
jgi:hypothetical protein